MTRTEQKIIHIQRHIHQPTGLLAAYSDDLKGLLVFGKSNQELDTKIPGAIRELLEAMGHSVFSIEPITDAGWVDSSKNNIRVELAEAA